MTEPLTEKDMKILQLTVEIDILDEHNHNLQELLAKADARVVQLEAAIDEYLVWGRVDDLIAVRPEPTHTPLNLEFNHD